MTMRLLADYPAMTRAAAAARQARNELIRVQHRRRDTNLDPDALGRILPSRDIIAAFEEANAATKACLWDVTHRCEDLSDGVRDVRDHFRDVDEAVATTFERLLVRVREVGQ